MRLDDRLDEPSSLGGVGRDLRIGRGVGCITIDKDEGVSVTSTKAAGLINFDYEAM